MTTLYHIQGSISLSDCVHRINHFFKLLTLNLNTVSVHHYPVRDGIFFCQFPQLAFSDTEIFCGFFYGYYVETPKTKSGNRVIPMSEKVLEAFQRVLNKRKYAQPVILEGYTKFLFLNRNGLPKVAVNYESMFRGLVRKYTKTQKVALPKVMTPHTLRHTFCTTLANAGMNPKALQYIMGHSNINMTLNYYAHTTSETSITEMKRLIA